MSDALSSFLAGPRARQAFLLRTVMSPPWSIIVEDEAPLTVVCVVRERATISFDDGESAELGPGDLALVRGPDRYLVADDPHTVPMVRVLPGQQCVPTGAGPATPISDLGVRTWGNDRTGTSVLLTGTYDGDGQLGRPLLDALPRLLVLRADEWTCPLLDVLADEIVRDEPGQEVVLDRLLDLTVVAAVRHWFTTGEHAPGWYRAGADPVVGPALRALHETPGEPWTVASLAAHVGVSRAALARRFAEIVGRPPMAYLAQLRLATAADLLADTDLKLGAIADRVGYGSAFALSAAFKRAYGQSPSDHRHRARAA